MKFDYRYRTSDNALHRDIIDAPDRESAYTILKARGIRPELVKESPGFFNKLFGKGKRWIAISILSVIVVVLAGIAVRTRKAVSEDTRILSVFDAKTRRQVIGDAAIIETGIKNGWHNVFQHEGECFLASFASPGVPAGQRSTKIEELEKTISRSDPINQEDGIEARQIKSMVAGMKDELRAFIRDGGSFKEYGERLIERQEKEIGYYTRAKCEVEALVKAGRPMSEIVEVLNRRNAQLRGMGIRSITISSEE